MNPIGFELIEEKLYQIVSNHLLAYDFFQYWFSIMYKLTCVGSIFIYR